MTDVMAGSAPHNADAPARRGLGGWLVRLVLLGCDVFAVLGLAYFVLRWTVGERFWPVALANVLLPWLLLPALVLLPLSFLGRWRPRRAALAGLAAAYLLLYGGLFIPGGANATDDVLTFAVHNISDDHMHPPSFAEYVLAHDIDVVGIVENSQWAGGTLAEHLADTHPYALNIGDGVEGKGLISRYPIMMEDIFTIATDRPNIHAVLDVDGTPVHVYVVHPPAPDFTLAPPRFAIDPNHAPEIDEIARRATAHDGPTVLLGDFNMPDQSPGYGQLRRAGFTDGFRAAGWGYGTTYSLLGMGPPLTRIDYVWLSDGLTAVEAFVAPEMISDHRALVVRAQLTP